MMRAVMILLLVLAMAMPALAQDRQKNPGRMIFDFSGEATLEGDARRPAEAGTRLLIDYDGRLTMGLLMGEPVIMVRMKYQIIGGSVTIPTVEPGKPKYETIDLDQIPSIARDKIGIYDMKMVFHFETPGNQDVRILEDGGAFMKANEYSFNVPGSPNWNQVFVTSLGDFTDRGIEYLDAESAKAFWGRGLALIDNEIHDAKLTLHDLHLWWRENNTIPEYKATMRAVERLRDAIQISYGYENLLVRLFEGKPEQDMAYKLAQEARTKENEVKLSFDNWFEDNWWWRVRERDNYFVEYGEAADYAREALRKLGNLPPNLRIGDNHEPYRQAVADAARMIEEVQAYRAAFQPEGVNPSTLPRGSEQRIDGTYEVVRDEENKSWVTEQGTGRRIRELSRDWEVLVQGAFLVVAPHQRHRYDCSGGTVQIHGKDPETGEEVTRFEFDCGSGFAFLWQGFAPNSDRNTENPNFLVLEIFDGAVRHFNPQNPKPCTGVHFLVTKETDGRSYRLDFDMQVIKENGPTVFKEGRSEGSLLCLRRVD